MKYNSHHKITYFKVCDSAVSSMFTESCSHHHYLILEHFHHSKKKLLWQSLQSSSPQPLKTTNPLLFKAVKTFLSHFLISFQVTLVSKLLLKMLRIFRSEFFFTS